MTYTDCTATRDRCTRRCRWTYRFRNAPTNSYEAIVLCTIATAKPNKSRVFRIFPIIHEPPPHPKRTYGPTRSMDRARVSILRFPEGPIIARRRELANVCCLTVRRSCARSIWDDVILGRENGLTSSHVHRYSFPLFTDGGRRAGNRRVCY